MVPSDRLPAAWSPDIRPRWRTVRLQAQTTTATNTDGGAFAAPLSAQEECCLLTALLLNREIFSGSDTRVLAQGTYSEGAVFPVNRCGSGA
jgi:hypothetical protein